MFRRLIAILALVGFILGQWAAVSHAHAGTQSADHSAMPHVHFSWLISEKHDHHADQDYHHGKHGHGKHQHGHGNHTHHEKAPVPVAAFDHVEFHDADAIYLPTVTVSCGISGRGSDLVFKTPLASAGLLMQSALTIPATSQWYNRDWKTMPDIRAPHCARFLELRTLRI